MGADGSRRKHRVIVDPLMAGLLPAYFARRSGDVKLIRRAISEQNFDVVRHLGHKMKGSGAGYGAPEVSQIGGRLEAAAIRRDSEESLRCVHALELYLVDLELVCDEKAGAREDEA